MHRRFASGAVPAIAIAFAALASSRAQELRRGALHEHAAIQYASRATTDPVARLNQTLEQRGQSFPRDARTGYLIPILDALGISAESQLLVFSKTGVQRAYTGPHTPRALFFNESVVVGYVPGGPAIELAAQDPRQGVVFYTIDQTAAAPSFVRQTTCLACHVSPATLDVPGMIVRSNTVSEDGNLIPRAAANDVNHETPHPDRWGGWFVTSEGVAAPYSQRAHAGNITFFGEGNTSSQIFVDWMSSAPESRGYLSPASDIAALLVFDHEMRAINLLTRLNWESRIAASAGPSNSAVRRLVDEVVDYFLFVHEAPPSVPLTPRRGFAERLERRTPKDRQGRSFGQLSLVDRLLRYPCSYMVYSDAFDALPADVKRAVYTRMKETLSRNDAPGALAHLAAADRHAILEILQETKPDFPAE